MSHLKKVRDDPHCSKFNKFGKIDQKRDRVHRRAQNFKEKAIRCETKNPQNRETSGHLFRNAQLMACSIHWTTRSTGSHDHRASDLRTAEIDLNTFHRAISSSNFETLRRQELLESFLRTPFPQRTNTCCEYFQFL